MIRPGDSPSPQAVLLRRGRGAHRRRCPADVLTNTGQTVSPAETSTPFSVGELASMSDRMRRDLAVSSRHQVLTDEQAEHFLEYGYVVVHDCFTEEAAAALTGSIWTR